MQSRGVPGELEQQLAPPRAMIAGKKRYNHLLQENVIYVLPLFVAPISLRLSRNFLLYNTEHRKELIGEPVFYLVSPSLSRPQLWKPPELSF